ncbi:MAG: glycosyltransferase, partial [Acidobacteriota bacterium]
MSTAFDLVVVIPVGPGEVLDFVLDTVQSVTHYTGGPTKIIIADDSGKGTGAWVQSKVDAVAVVKTPRNQGLHGGLYLTLSQAYLHANRHYAFKVLLKLDSDALVIGPHPDQDAIRFFSEHPDVGIIGLVGHGTAPDVDDHHWSKSRLREETHGRSFLRDPIRGISLRRLVRRATANGFRPGDYIYGGSYFMSAACVHKLAAANLLLRGELGRSLLEEDHLFGILAKAAGLELADFCSGDLPSALEAKRLPCAPEELVARNKKVTHSVRRWEDLDES